MGGEAARVDEMVGLLQARDAAGLDALRRAYPEESQLLQPGIIAGDAPTVREKNARRRQLYLELAVRSAEAIVSLSHETVSRASSRIDTSFRLDFMSRIVSVLSSSSLIAGLALQFSAVMNYASALTALASSLVPIASSFLLRTRNIGTESSLPAAFPRLIECNIRASGLLDELTFMQATETVNPARIDEHLRALNELAADAKRFARLVP